MKMLFYFNVVLWVFSINPTQTADYLKWELVKVDDGISIYTAKDVKSDITKYKVETIVNASLSSVVGVIQDIQLSSDFFENGKEIKLIKSEGDHYFETYVVADLPWPIQNRSSYIQSTFNFDANVNKVFITSVCCETCPTESKDGVFVKNCEADWELTALDHLNTKVVSKFYAVDEGSIPNWIIHRKIIKTSIDSFKKLSTYVRNEKYDSKSFFFMSH